MKTGHADKARELFNDGYNCSQAVLGAFAEDAGLDVKTALRLSAPFGGGMGRMREVCGGVSGMFMAIGLFFGYDEPDGAQEERTLLICPRPCGQVQRERGLDNLPRTARGSENSARPRSRAEKHRGL